MNIQNSVSSALDPQSARVDQRAPRTASEGTIPTTTRGNDPAPARVTPGSRRSAEVIPLQAPAGTDPELWSILTNEERAFFSRSVTSGPLTYSRMMMPDRAAAPSAPAALGRRVDVRV